MDKTSRLILELQYVTYVRIFFGRWQVTFPYEEIHPIFGQSHVTCPYIEPLSFVVGLHKKQVYFVFQIHLFRKQLYNQKAAVMLLVISSFYAKLSKNSPFISANTSAKYMVSQGKFIARQDDKMCCLPICKYHNLLIRDIKELLKSLDAFCFNYQQMDCL